MVDYNLIKNLDVDDSAVERELMAAFGELPDSQKIEQAIDETIGSFQAGHILAGKVVGIVGDDVIVDVGLKSEGVIPLNEWSDKSSIEPGDPVEVLLEAIESDSGVVLLSKRKADRIRGWERLISTTKEGDTVTGVVTRKIKGGLLVDIGVPAFLPASQVDIRRPADIGDYIGKQIEAKILKIDTDRRNIVISRRRLIEQQRSEAKNKLMAELEVGQLRKGVVKNLADFGAFIDLGGIDGLLHITDMSWDRINHPSDMLRIDEEVEIKILNIDREKEKIALGLKQTKENPWETIEERYLVDSRISGEVVNIVNYGAFIKLEPGVEGLVHISEMSWTRRINHPSELIQAGETIEVVVLEVNKDKQEISLGLKQTEVNPWMRVAEKYPPNTIVEGQVRNLTNYGVFIEIEQGIDGLLHVSDMSWTKKIGHPSEVAKKGDLLKCVVLTVDQEKQRIALGLKQLTEDPWLRAVPEKYIPGQIVKGKVTKITNFGVFVELEPDLEGLLHISELADHKVEDPHEVVKVGEELEVKILRVDNADRKIGLSKKRAEWAAEDEPDKAAQKQPPKPRRGGLHGVGDIRDDIINEVVFRQPRDISLVPEDQQSESTEQAADSTETPPSDEPKSTEPAEQPEPSASAEPAADSTETPPSDEPTSTEAAEQPEPSASAEQAADSTETPPSDEPKNTEATEQTDQPEQQEQS